MKKLITTFCIALFVPTLSACGADEPSYQIAEAGSWTDGTYTQSGKGYRGNLPVTVTIEGGKMTDIEVGKNDETPDRGGQAIKKMPDAMIEAQSYDVDGISGATRTSDGIKDAVARALEDASKDTNN